MAKSPVPARLRTSAPVKASPCTRAFGVAATATLLTCEGKAGAARTGTGLPPLVVVSAGGVTPV